MNTKTIYICIAIGCVLILGLVYFFNFFNVTPDDQSEKKTSIRNVSTSQEEANQMDSIPARVDDRDIQEELTLEIPEKEQQQLDFVDRDISEELERINNIPNLIEVPDDPEVIRSIKVVLENACRAWAECQDLINSQELKMNYWNGMYSASWRSPDEKIVISFQFKSDKADVNYCSKRINSLEDGVKNDTKVGYHLFFNNEQNLRLYQSADRKQTLEFDESGNLRAVGFSTSDGKLHTVSWDENGHSPVHRMSDELDEPMVSEKAKEVE